MFKFFEEIIFHLFSGHRGKSLLKVDLQGQIDAPEPSLKAINAAFLILLSGKNSELYRKARGVFEEAKGHTGLKRAVEFYELAFECIKEEINAHPQPEKIKGLSEYLRNTAKTSPRMATIERIRECFFPEGVGICQRKDELREALRNRRRVSLKKLNPKPIKKPSEEMLFTSNVLLTVPSKEKSLNELDLSSSLKKQLERTVTEEQLYWYDHPIQIGVETDRNEAVYGLRGLSDALRFEKALGVASRRERLKCLLSVSVTHRGLHSIARNYIEDELRKSKAIEDMDVYIFTEDDTRRLVEEVLQPAAKKLLGVSETDMLFEVFGVDGEYGRHYSFLKAVVPLWSVLIDPRVRATFKIDLDQVFPEEHLVKETGKSAFQHLMTPLWGAKGRDWVERPVSLGLLAGALVNQKDIGRSLFTPDVCYPPEDIRADEVIFFSPLPQALSTEAEMMTRYDDVGEFDGRQSCIQRYHVTGGTTGALVEALRRWRPFTPGFVGRAEDQAYIMSVLFDEQEGELLRYLHCAGLIMRHDKEAFASEAIRAAWAGKTVGDYVRLIVFSLYAEALGWSVRDIKAELDPFTGCFISAMPFTVSILRLTLKAAAMFDCGDDERAEELLEVGFRRIGELIRRRKTEPRFIKRQYESEKQGWGLYYDIIDALEAALQQDDGFSIKIQEKMHHIVSQCKLNL